MDSNLINQLKSDINCLDENMLGIITNAAEFNRKLLQIKQHLSDVSPEAENESAHSAATSMTNGYSGQIIDNLVKDLKDKVNEIKVKQNYIDSKVSDIEKLIQRSKERLPEPVIKEEILNNDDFQNDQLLTEDFQDLPDEEFMPQKSGLKDQVHNHPQDENIKLNGEYSRVPEQEMEVSNAIFKEDTRINAAEEIKWITQVIPLKSPYYPQIGDQLVYFHQGHKAYLEASFKDQVFNRDRPWILYQIQPQEFVKVIGISYEMNPSQACLELKIESGRHKDMCLKVKYHDMEGVVDFLILKQQYDQSLGRTWLTGNKFRCAINETWYNGTILSIKPFEDQHSNSQFKCYHIKWDDDGKEDVLSAWELEPLDYSGAKKVSATDLILHKEMSRLLYKPEPEDWPAEGRDVICQKIIYDLDQLMKISTIEPLVALNSDCTYTANVDYPVDLMVIKQRLRNRFYRRISAITFDVNYIEKNIETIKSKKINIDSLSKTMNKDIGSTCKLVTKALLEIIKKPKTLDIKIIIAALENSEELPDEYFTDDNQNEYMPTQSSQNLTQPSVLSEMSNLPWRRACTKILEELYKSEHSTYFREIENLDDNLSSIKEQHEVGNYKTPLGFKKDVERLFANCKKKVINKESKVYKECIALEKFFHDLIGPIAISCRSPEKTKVSTENSMSPVAGPARRRRSDTSGVTPPKKRRIYVIEDDTEADTDSSTNDDSSTGTSDGDSSIGTTNDDFSNNTTNFDSSIDRGESKKMKNDELIANGIGVILYKLSKPRETRTAPLSYICKNYSPSHVLKFSLQPGKKNMYIQGKVESIFDRHTTYSNQKHKYFELFKFIVSNGQGVKVQCVAWEDAAIHYYELIKVEKVIYIRNPNIANAAPGCNDGNVIYEFKIFQDTDIYIEP